MRLVLIRHTRVGIDPGICYGVSDVPLADSFADEAAGVRERGRELWRSPLIFSSDLGRCQKLARFLFSEQDIRLDARLRELNFGDWELRAWNELPESEVRGWGDDYVRVAPPGGESFLQLHDRVGEFWRELLASGLEEAVVVLHAGTLRSMLAWALGLDLTQVFQLEIERGGITALRIESGDLPNRLLYLNR